MLIKKSQFWKRHQRKLLLAAGLFISVLALAGALSTRSETEVSRLDRPSVSDGSSQKSLSVIREDGSRSEIRMNFKPRKYNQDEVEAIF